MIECHRAGPSPIPPGYTPVVTVTMTVASGPIERVGGQYWIVDILPSTWVPYPLYNRFNILNRINIEGNKHACASVLYRYFRIRLGHLLTIIYI